MYKECLKKQRELPSYMDDPTYTRLRYVRYADDALMGWIGTKSEAEIIKESDIPQQLIKILGQWHASRIDKMVEDVVEVSLKEGLQKIAMSKEILDAVIELRDFLYDRVYFNPNSMVEIEKAKKK